MATDPQNVYFASGLWWRQSMLNAARCVPAILVVRSARLRLASATDVALDAPTPEVAASFSRLGTMTLRNNGKKFDIVGKAARLSPEFTNAQLDELRHLQADVRATGIGMEVLDLGGSVAGLLGASAVGAGTGLLGLAFDINNLVANIRPWRTVLAAAGVRVE